jgi:YD repeat-containing protein
VSAAWFIVRRRPARRDPPKSPRRRSRSDHGPWTCGLVARRQVPRSRPGPSASWGRPGQVESASFATPADPTGQTDLYSYSPDLGRLSGQVASRASTPPKDQQAPYAYDAIGDVTAYPNGTTMSYVPPGSTIPNGQLTTRTRPDGTVDTFSYDALGERTAVTGDNTKLGLRYDQAGRLTEYDDAGPPFATPTTETPCWPAAQSERGKPRASSGTNPVIFHCCCPTGTRSTSTGPRASHWRRSSATPGSS